MTESEYKTEIERLKAENEKMRKERGYINQLKEELLLKHYHVDCYQEEIKKQAKIDVLNKLKDSYGLYYLSAFGVKERMLADILNPMIEELRNDTRRD